MKIEGRGASLELTEEDIVIRRYGIISLVNVGLGTGEKRISIREITSIQFKEPDFLTVGFIHFGYKGGLDKVNGLLDAGRDENSVLFDKSKAEGFRQLRQALEERRAAIRKEEEVRGSVSTSIAEEIRRFADLRDKGILTSEEFDAKKKQLLGL